MTSVRLCCSTAALMILWGIGPARATAQSAYGPLRLMPAPAAPQPTESPSDMFAPPPDTMQELPVLETSAAWVPPEVAIASPPVPYLMFGDDPGDPPGYLATVGTQTFVGAVRTVPRLDVIYDTGFVGSGHALLPSTVALDGTRAARQRGNFLMSAAASVVEFGAISAEGRFRANVQLNFVDTASGSDDMVFGLVGRPQFRTAQVEAAEILGGRLYGGRSYTTFMDPYAIPMSLTPETTAAGSVYRLQPQLALERPVADRWSGSLAIELGPKDDFTLPDPDDDVRLQRWPDFVASLRYASSGEAKTNDTLALAALVRAMGYEDVANEEHFATGWGLCLMAEIRTWGCDKLQFGCVGGYGVGGYIFGFAGDTDTSRPAAGPLGGDLDALANFGTYAGYTRVWSDHVQSNLGYGVALADPNSQMDQTVRQVHNAWINHFWYVVNGLSLGVEYHYAVQELRDSTRGDNHRVMLATQIAK